MHEGSYFCLIHYINNYSLRRKRHCVVENISKMLWSILLVIATILLWRWLTKSFSYWEERSVPQSRPWVIFGDMWPQVLKRMNQFEWIEWLYKMHPDQRYSGFYWFSKPVLAIRDPELIKQLGIKDFDHFTDHRPMGGGGNSVNDPLFSQNLFSLKGQQWRDMRSKLSGFFTSSKMKYMFQTIAEASENFVKNFEKQNKDILELEMKETYKRFTSDVIASVAFGIQVDSVANPENEFFRMGNEILDIRGFKLTKVLLKMAFPWLAKLSFSSISPKLRTTFFQKVINETIEFREKNAIVRPDMINLLLEVRRGVKREDDKVEVNPGNVDVMIEDNYNTDKQERKEKLTDITNEYIASQAFVFFLAGFDTVSTALTFATYELVANPNVQSKLRLEIKETLENNNGKITYEAISNMKYMHAVLAELLRIWPPAGAMDRVCTKPYTIEPTKHGERPVKLSPGDVIWFPYAALHRDPTYWPNPEKFDPERFSEENRKNLVPYTYFPFGVGPRNCIGSRFALLEVKCVLFHLLQHFEFIPTRRTRIPIRLEKNAIRHNAIGGFWFGVKKSEL